MTAAAGAVVAGNDELQHLLDRATHFLRGQARNLVVLLHATEPAGPLGDERVHVRAEVSNVRRASLPSELTEGHQERHSRQDASSGVPLFGQPVGLPLHFRTDPRRPDPVDR
jgi:hypothetical protein